MLSPNNNLDSSTTTPMVSVRVHGSSPPVSNKYSPQQRLGQSSSHSHVNNNTTTRSPVVSPQHSSSMQSQTLSDLKKIRQMSRVKLPSPKQPAQSTSGENKASTFQSHISPQVASASRLHNDMHKSNPAPHRKINPQDSNPSFLSQRKSSNSRGSSSNNIQYDEDRVQQDTSANRRFASSNSEVVGPSFKKKSCCKIM